ncbi:MAG: bifunctional (p)ppGpp synthetase/guanosine-3',5'-bis(diphosphate) 3'-pyrophosphohydrolase [Acidobacteriota bacterium]|nr:bifunctional (p)ppGpp synthetase/guanosine-3',5'-bis(diphosphate) 3'-pyrophosphohydrolase [Acidobacteriota bacterium]
MISCEDLEKTIQKHHPSADLELLRKAYTFSAREHGGQTRQSGEPYLSHPLQVANILAEMQLDVACVSVGLLHDVVEDTLTTVDAIREYFGEDIAHLVDGVTKISQIRFASRQEKQAENFRKLLLAMVDDIRVILVKLADRLDNLRTLEYLPPEKRKIIARETLDVYIPIAHRLGMAKVRGEMEDLAFLNLDPVACENISDQIERQRASVEQFSQEIMQLMRARFKEEDIKATMGNRVKRNYSTYQKIKQQKIGIDQVHDLLAIRILVDTVSECYTILGIVHDMWNPVPGRIKDFIATPRRNQYQSLHTTVVSPDGGTFELQIRTHEMDRVAEEGIAAHWKYKEGKLGKDKDDKRFQWLRQLLEWQHEVNDPHQFLSNLKIDLYPEEVYTFTPRGEVITLPRGTTPVDFAYAIHTEVGHKCVGARINGRIVPLKYKLNNGEMVEIVTAKGAQPNREWLNFVKTSRARNALRRWINLKKKEEAVTLGKKLLQDNARVYKITLKKYKDKLDTLVTDLEFSQKDDLFAAVGFGTLSPRQVLGYLDPKKIEEGAQEDVESKFTQVVKKVLRRSDVAIQVSGHDDILVSRAQCCDPIRGEEIMGYMTSGRGVSVHSVDCSNIEKFLLDPERKIKVTWTTDGQKTIYPIRLLVSTEDRKGILADITSAVSTVKTNIANVNADIVDNCYGLIDMTVDINDAQHLDEVMNCVKAIRGVRDIERSRNPANRKSKR